ncbi:MAG: hypothetical protein LBR32_02380 [Propionibacteriaceae bacterium]|jgi:hypothetical protein|nr:hypothetical protein [Propionibacteriaceae bacterium]
MSTPIPRPVARLTATAALTLSLAAGLLATAPSSASAALPSVDCTAAGVPAGCVAAAPVAKTKIKIVGTAKVGKTVKAKTSAKKVKWSVSGVKTTYQWLVGGVVVKTGAKYKIKAANAGQKLQLRAVGTLAGFPQGTKTSAKKSIPKLTPKVTISVPKVKANKAFKITVKISGKGVTPKGYLEMYDKNAWVKVPGTKKKVRIPVSGSKVVLPKALCVALIMQQYSYTGAEAKQACAEVTTAKAKANTRYKIQFRYVPSIPQHKAVKSKVKKFTVK